MFRNFRALTIIILLSIWSIELISQTPNNWFFGQKAGIFFNGAIINSGIDNNLNTPEGCAVYDGIGLNSFIYSNGDKIWGSNHSILTNGDNLSGSMNSCQSALFFKPYKSQNIYLFTTDEATGSNGLTFNVLKPNVSTYQVISKNNILFPNSSERMTLTNHCDRKSAWLITHEKNTDRFFSFKITPDSLDIIPVITVIGSSHSGNIQNNKGCIKASSDSEKIAVAKMGSGEVEIFRFDNLTGILHDPLLISNISNAYGVEFDLDGNYLYVSTASGILYQFSLQNWNTQAVINSKTIISNQSQLLGSLQIGPDHKIYVSKDNSPYLGRIEHPGSMGTGCTYNPTAVYLNGKKSEAGLPQTFTTKTMNDLQGVKICLGDTAFFKILGDTTYIDSVLWDFGDNLSIIDTSTLFSPYYIYPIKSVFEVTLIIYYCNISDTLINWAETLGPPHPYLGPDTSFCDNIGLNLFGGNAVDYLWDDGSTSPSRFVNSPGTYWVQLTTSCGSNIDSVTINNVFASPVVSLPNDTLICFGDSIQLEATNLNTVNIWNSNDTSNYFIAKSSGSYILTSTDTNGCIGSDQFSLQILLPPFIDLGPDTTVCIGKAITFNGVAQGENFWQDGSMGHDYSPQEDEIIILRASNICGIANDTVVVSFAECEQIIFVPNCFTPNGDGLNDVFLPWTENVKKYKLRIFDRWGYLVFETTNTENGWDGNFDYKQSQEDAYIWVIEYSNYKNQNFINKGTVTLYR